ncbi:lacI family transcriptional regulator [Agrilactobacillus composti DSM 18527 = JCM 14202]|uniref:LacI family transcriptional regulator n=1 Tax=Agrilactobacillus composti DSM 18527 = JCM 14202 TaxID=1423734 RepID=X0PRU9_9LACO|nr:LacI family DNA-binding transcriptional regulator [Agrilactobacillus composti]KRM32475.1 lacI family transcriptional regulator [Agrilactobacillus composti DSM 18527 = JCM 14202]GAF39906.1 galactose operon repressor, GalR-LacI family of transcriptional regulators [Agrilactobacillus composti DSM 18527 = JCM 14202]
MTTIKDIAEQAKVSISTVSRILSFDETLSVTDETRQRVLQTAEDLQYKRRSRKAKRRITANIGIVQWHTMSQELNDLYYMQIQNGVENKANSLGIATESMTLDEILGQDSVALDGLIMIGKFDRIEIRDLKKLKLPMVFVGQNTLPEGFDSVQSDYETPIKTIIDHYLKHHIKDIGMLIGQEQTSKETDIIPDPRLVTFTAYLRQLNLFEPKFVFKGDYSPESGFEMMDQAIKQLGPDLPHGFILGSDAMAVGALRALSQADIAVPERVSIVSFNDVAIAKFTTPTLSTIHSQTELMGERAISLLKKRLENPKRIPQSNVYASEFIRRESSI